LTEPLQVGQFAIVDHEPVDRGPNAGVFHGKGPVDDRAELYVVAEGTTPAGEAFAGHVVSAIGQAWTTFDISLTGSLRRLFSEAERNIDDWNKRSIAQHRMSLGLTAFARKGRQAVIAQGGPTVAFHLADGEIRMYAAEEEFAKPLGTSRGFEPQLLRVEFTPGDRILVLSSAALGSLDDEVISGILALPAAQVLPELYRRLNQLRHLTVLLVTSDAKTAHASLRQVTVADEEAEFVIGADMEIAPPPSTDNAGDSIYQPSLFIGDEDAEAAMEIARRQLNSVIPRTVGLVEVPILMTERVEPLRRAAGDDTLSRLAAERRASANAAQSMLQGGPTFSGAYAASANAARPAWRGPQAAGNEAAHEVRQSRHSRRGSFSRGLSPNDAPPPLPTVNAEEAPLVYELAEETRGRNSVTRPIAETIAGESAASMRNGDSLVRVRNNMGGRWRAGNSSGGRKAISSGQSPPTWLVVLGGIAFLMAVVGYATVPKLLSEDANARYAGLVQDARKALTTSQVQQDPGERRKALSEAQSLLLEARSLSSAGPEVTELIDQVAGAISTMDAVRSPASVTAIGDLSQFGERPVAAARLVATDLQAFILDSATPQVIAVALANGEKRAIFLEDKDQRRGRPVAIALSLGDGSGPALMIADGNRTLFEYRPDGTVRIVPFAAPPNLAITDMAAFGRDLYVLDAAANAVWKWAPSENGFGQAPTKVLDSKELGRAQRLMVDGEIITADQDGTLRRFTGQVSLRLEAAGIDEKLVTPESPVALTKNGEIGVLDATNNRIVVLRRDGTFERQYRHKDFQSMTAFTVGPSGIYVFSAGQLRKIVW
jgi:hypothetical protein